MRASRLDIRTSHQAKATLEEAAAMLGITISAFVLEAAMKKAHEVLKESHTIQLSNEGHERLMSAMDNPPEPTQSLKDLFKKHE